MNTNTSCKICRSIPEYLEVDVMHTPDRLPKAVDQLRLIGGVAADAALGQIRQCPACDAFFLFFHDHDSESGTGYGYTDESIMRIDEARVREALERNIEFFERAVRYKEDELKKTNLPEIILKNTQKHLLEDREELLRLTNMRNSARMRHS